MPKGSKQARQEQHIIDSEKKRGKSQKDAERIAYSTINKRKKGKK